ncbi:MAG: hypothetical protein CL927_00265 [Deltaproteobacteria bacterium]|nr:hypothetical protein [Deltaproteobacteria bacterium]HCH66719.1 hypothetical protein [Deltaproteobacteria bacterium]
MTIRSRSISFTAVLALGFAVLATLPLVALLLLNQSRLEVAILASLDRQLEEVKDHALGTVRSLRDEAAQVLPVVAATVVSDLDRYRGSAVDNVLHAAVVAVPGIDAMYVSFEDGAHRVVTRMDLDRREGDVRIPAGARWHSSWIDPFSAGAKRSRHRAFHGEWGAQVEAQWKEPTTLDLRALPHYRRAQETGSLAMIEPTINPDTGYPVVSLAHPIEVNGEFVGVVGANLTFRHLSAHLARNRASARGLTVVFDQEGRIIAHPNPVFALQAAIGDQTGPAIALPDLTAAALEVAAAQVQAPGAESTLFERTLSGERYHLLASPFMPAENVSWTVVTAAPESDFVGETRRALRTLAVIIVGVTTLQVLLIGLFARRIGSQIRAMSARFRSIRSLQFEEGQLQRTRDSWIRELADLESGFQLLVRSMETFSRFVPRGVVRHLVTSEEEVRPAVEQRELALFFCDLQGFTSLAEQAEPEVLLRQVSAYFDAVTSSISAEGGTIDKFIGDAVMAFWGAPDHHPDPALAAARAALRVRHRFAALAREWEAEGLSPLHLRIGVHIAPVLVGTIGTDVRLSYTALGDGVNVASRLESANKELGTAICISDAVRAAAPALVCRPIRRLTVKGRREPLLVHELLGVRESSELELQAPARAPARVACGREVAAALLQDHIGVARTTLQAHLEADPDDRPARVLMDWLTARETD